jgi:hypothetical protein
VRISLRNAVVVASLMTAAVVGAPSANAAVVTALEFTGDVTIASFGTGISNGTATLCVNGLVSGGVATCTSGTNATATFGVTESAASCPLLGTAWGSVTVQTSTGPKTGGFTATQIGTDVYISGTSGAFAGGHGNATFVIEAGIACGQTNVHATISGWFV